MWPNWQGETAVIVASGPGTKDIRLSDARNRARVMVVKENWTLAPWADAMYGSDGPWWEEHKGVPEFQGLKFSASPRAAKLFPDVQQVSLANGANILLDKPGLLGCGSRFGNGHSGFHALNLVAQFGPLKIVLVGFDLTLENGPNWHDKPRMVPATKSLMSEWREALDCCASQFVDAGIQVVNASPLSALKNYPMVDFQEAVSQRTKTSVNVVKKVTIKGEAAGVEHAAASINKLQRDYERNAGEMESAIRARQDFDDDDNGRG